LKQRISGNLPEKDQPSPASIRTLLLDIGNVILTNGWDRDERKRAIQTFGLDEEEFNERHQAFFESLERGRISLHQYLDHTIFYKKRDFAEEEFISFILNQSEPIKYSLDYFISIKDKYRLKVFSLNNEGHEVNEYRIKTFRLDRLFDGYISSCFVHLRKPDKEFFKLGCEITNTAPEDCLFIDDRLMHVQIAKTMGLNAIQFTTLSTVKKQMTLYGLSI